MIFEQADAYFTTNREPDVILYSGTIHFLSDTLLLYELSLHPFMSVFDASTP